MTSKRCAQIDLVKSLATLFVIMVHFLLHSGYYDVSISTPISYFYLILRKILITCVPLFIMATGYLMASKELNNHFISKFIKSYFVYAIISLITWLISTLFLSESFTLVEALLGILGFYTIDYAWYFEMYLGLYLMIPILNNAWKKTKHPIYHKYLLTVAFILFFLPSFFNTFNKLMPDYWVNAYPIGYYYLGVAFKTYQEKINRYSLKKLITYLIVCLSLFSVIDLINNYGKPFIDGEATQYYGYQVLLMAMLLFNISFQVRLSPKWQHVVKVISEHSLLIYLFSDIYDRIFYHYLALIVPTTATRIYFFPVTLLVFFCSLLSSLLLNKILKKGGLT